MCIFYYCMWLFEQNYKKKTFCSHDSKESLRTCIFQGGHFQETPGIQFHSWKDINIMKIDSHSEGNGIEGISFFGLSTEWIMNILNINLYSQSLAVFIMFLPQLTS